MMKRMSRLLLSLWVCSAFLLSAACTTKPAADPPPSAAPQAEGVKLRIDGERLVPDITRNIPMNEADKPDIRDLLLNSGIIMLNGKKDGILSVGDISLDSGLSWAVKVNGSDLEASAWGERVNEGDDVLVYLKGNDGASASVLKPVVLRISGGISKPNLQVYFVNKYQANLTVRDVLKRCGMIQMNDPGRLVTAVNGYTGNINEQWVVKLNNKRLLPSGLDISLQPSDKLEVVLSQI